MSIEDKIKVEVMKTTYDTVDKLFDHMSQRFLLSDADQALLIEELNRLKDRLHTMASKSRLA